MDEPEYLICINCETPCYTFEWQEIRATDVLCTVCGADEPDEFTTEEEFEAMTTGMISAGAAPPVTPRRWWLPAPAPGRRQLRPDSAAPWCLGPFRSRRRCRRRESSRCA